MQEINNNQSEEILVGESEVEILVKDPEQLVKESVWTSEKLAQLLGYENEDKNTQDLKILEENQNHEIEADDNQIIVEQSELFENQDPKSNKTKHNFSNSPFTKFATVGLVMLVLFVVFGAILNAMTSEGPTIAPSLYAKATKSPNSEETVNPTADSEKEKLENGKLKASLALSEQVEKIKAVEESKNSNFQISRIKKQPTTNDIKSEEVPPSPPPVKVVEHSEPPPRTYRPPKRVVAAIVDKPKSQTEDNAGRDPIEQLQAINRLGSYGSETIPQPPEEKLKDQNFKVDTQATLQNPQIIEVNKPSGQTVLQNSSLQQTQFLPEESKIIDSINNKNYLRVGSIIPGKLVSPLIWVEQDTQNNNQTQKIVIVTTKAVRKNNQTILPANTQIIANVANVQSGIVQLQATQLVFDDKEYSVPSEAITINASGGKPLIASLWNNKHGQTARDAEIFLLGSLATVGNVLNQPRSQQFSSNSGFGSSSTFSSTQRKRGNILGAVLSGGFSPLTNQILQRNQKALQQKIRSKSKVWFLKADTKIEIFVNQSFSL